MEITLSADGLWCDTFKLKPSDTNQLVCYHAAEMIGIYDHALRLFFQGVIISETEELHTLVDGDHIDARWTLISGNHPLHYAAANNNLLAVQRWVSSGTPVDIRNDHQTTPLYDAMSDRVEFEVF